MISLGLVIYWCGAAEQPLHRPVESAADRV